MPANFADLLTVSGLVALTVLIVGLLKAIPSREGTHIYVTLAWINENQFITSLIVAGLIAAIAYAVREFGYMPYAEHYWQGALFLWAAAQALYNGQKGLSHVLKGKPN